MTIKKNSNSRSTIMFKMVSLDYKGTYIIGIDQNLHIYKDSINLTTNGLGPYEMLANNTELTKLVVIHNFIFALHKMKVFNVTISNRTKAKAENLKSLYNDLEIVNWGEVSNFDMIINATSIGLKKEDRLNLDFSKFQDSEFFYDVIYNPKETNFLKDGKMLGKKTENGNKMFIFQAAQSFKIWHGIEPSINNEVIKLLKYD